jgi:hypothetical protein
MGGGSADGCIGTAEARITYGKATQLARVHSEPTVREARTLQ